MHPFPIPVVALVLHFRTVPATAACLASLRKQGAGAALLVDNSEDGGRSLASMQTLLEAMRTGDFRVDTLEPGQNLGFSAGVNAGLAEIRRRHGAVRVLLLNSDAELADGALPLLESALDRGADLVAPEIVEPDGRRRRGMHYHRLTGVLTEFPLPGSIFHLSGCCLLLSEAMAASALLDERFFFYGEDAYLGWRLRQRGAEVRLVSAARVLHAGSQSSRRGSLFYEYHMARAHLELARALALGPVDMWWLLVGRAVILPARALLRSARQRSPVPLRALSMALADFRAGRIRRLTPPAS
jgi:GT2 family glycosyltransferase